jgi:lactoylglutathione lyase
MGKFTFEHIHLRSPNPEATAGFYERVFGAEILRSAPAGKPRIDLNLGGQKIFIAEVQPNDKTGAPPESPYQGLDHIGLTVTGIDAIVTELRGKGVRFTMEPTTIRPGVRIAFLRGPENVSIELIDRNAA